jgi:transposase
MAFIVTPGQAHDLVGAGTLLQRVATPQRLIADRSYDARTLRDWQAERGGQVVIPPNPTRKNPASYDPVAYKTRNLIERMFRRLKDFRRIATRKTSAPIHTSPPSSWSQPSYGGLIEYRP